MFGQLWKTVFHVNVQNLYGSFFLCFFFLCFTRKLDEPITKVYEKIMKNRNRNKEMKNTFFSYL